MHLGNVFCALIAWLDARAQGERMLLRIEDLDPDRCRRAYAMTLMEDLRYLGLDWDEGGEDDSYFQSTRRDIYEQALHKLEEKGLVYPCFCTRAQLHAASAPHAIRHSSSAHALSTLVMFMLVSSRIFRILPYTLDV